MDKENKGFEKLGVWNWNRDGFPPYWDSLRTYIFRRDKYRCSRCRKRFKTKMLDAHHIVWREHGGSDNPKNLVTVCESCHNKIHHADLPMQEISSSTSNESIEKPRAKIPVFEANGIQYQLPDDQDWEFEIVSPGVTRFRACSRLAYIQKWHRNARITIKERRAKFFEMHIYEGRVVRDKYQYRDESLCGARRADGKGSFSKSVLAICNECFDIADARQLLKEDRSLRPRGARVDANP